MAAVDPIAYAQLCKLFPALTLKQATNSCFYSIGGNYQDISELLDATPVAVKKSLESSRKYFATDSLPDLRAFFLCRLTFRLVCQKYQLPTEDFLNILHIDLFKVLNRIFPELNKFQLKCAVMHSVGISISDIAIHERRPASSIETLIIESMKVLGITSKSLLRLLITSRFIVDLC